jgi:hypothetical protein
MDTYIAQIADRFQTTTDEVLSFLESPTGKRLRRTLATGLIVSVPLIMRIPGLRKTFVGRAVEMVGGAALVIKLAELIRDWERGQVAA